MHPAYAAKLRLPVRKRDIGAQKIDESPPGGLQDGHRRLSDPGPAGRGGDAFPCLPLCRPMVYREGAYLTS